MASQASAQDRALGETNNSLETSYALEYRPEHGLWDIFCDPNAYYPDLSAFKGRLSESGPPRGSFYAQHGDIWCCVSTA